MHFGKAAFQTVLRGVLAVFGEPGTLCEINLLLIFRSYLKQLKALLTLCIRGKLGSVLGGRGPRVRWLVQGNRGQPAVAWNSSVGKGTEKWGSNSRPFPTLVQSSLLHLHFLYMGVMWRVGLGIHVQGPLQSRSYSEARGWLVEVFQGELQES